MRRSGGLSLLELLIALAVIAIVFLALLSGQITGIRTTAGARDIADAKTFANRSVESVRQDITKQILTAAAPATPESVWDDFYGSSCPEPADTAPPATASTPAECRGAGTSSSGVYSQEWVVGPKSATIDTTNLTDEGVLEIRMRVDWTKGGAKTLSIVDYISCTEFIDVAPEICPEPFGPDIYPPSP